MVKYQHIKLSGVFYMRLKEGRRIKSEIPMNQISPFLMPDRNGASNSFSASVDIENCEKIIAQLKKEGYKGISIMHILMAAYVRVVSQLPGVNRFIRGQRLYSRNSIEICMTIKKELLLNAPETVIKLNLSPSDTIYTIYDQLSEEIEKNKQEGDNNGTDTAARILISFPGIFLKFTVWFLKTIDYFGLLPRAITKISPFHGSLYLTNLGSLGIPPVFHHLYDFGNIPMFIAMGAKRRERYLSAEGEITEKRMMDITIVCDERICDGHYYAAAFKRLKKLLEKPEQLLTPPETIVKDID